MRVWDVYGELVYCVRVKPAQSTENSGSVMSNFNMSNDFLFCKGS